jgi:hypothetical protein
MQDQLPSAAVVRENDYERNFVNLHGSEKLRNCIIIFLDVSLKFLNAAFISKVSAAISLHKRSCNSRFMGTTGKF